MRRVLIVAVLGLLWTVTAMAQGEPILDGEDYAPADPAWPFPLHSTHPADGGLISGGGHPYYAEGSALQQRAAASEAFVAATLRDAPEFQLGTGKNVDASLLEQVMRSKSRLTWRILCPMALSGAAVGIGGHEGDWQFAADYPAADILYDLCFLDALPTHEVGPDMGPFFKEPLLPAEDDFRFWTGFFR